MAMGLGFKERSCAGKVKFKKAKHAFAASRALGLHPYRCEFCRRWHIGHPHS